MSSKYLTLIFPAYNESKRLPASLRTAVEYLCRQEYSSEIIVVDDGSTDGTADVARAVLKEASVPFHILSHEENRGKGFAVKTGFKAAEGDIVFFSDADLSTPIEELEKLLPYFEQGWDIVIGSRGLQESKIEIRQAWFREYAGRTFNLLVQLFVFPGIKDTQCGFKGFKRKVLPDLAARQLLHGFAFDVEILWIARKLGYSIKEVPIRWLNDSCSKVGLFSDSCRMFLDILKIGWMHKRDAARHTVDTNDS